jgi:hypothetical protein
VPIHFKEALIGFGRSLKRNFAIPIAANPEDQLKGPTQDLLRATAEGVEPRTEAQVESLGARPDIGVAVRGLLCGYVELKAPGKGARTNRFSGQDKKQWEKFKALPNLLYTDGTVWALYRSGEIQGSIVEFSGDVIIDAEKAFNDSEIGCLHTLLLDFLTWQPIPPGSALALAKTLAPLCRLLREDVVVALRNSDSALSQLAREWREYLFPEADDVKFADAYAQTLTYALLLARLNGEQHLTTASAADTLDSGHGLLAQALRILTQPQARVEIAVPVELLERIVRAVDPMRLRERGDPWLYFYEDFLSIYDSKLRKSYGVYYTPVPVIEAQINLVSELLRDESGFNKTLSFADEDVVFLDPGAGTAAYPLAAIEHALGIVKERYGDGMVAARATDCARNFHAFEILVGPYAVAHLRLTKLISDKNGTLPSDGIRVYLTDTLESPHANPPQPPLFARVLTEEHRRAQHIKNRTRVLVCMGNPPYEREQHSPGEARPGHRKGGWVRYGDIDDPHNRPILQDFIEGALAVPTSRRNVQNLYNDYVYFWRWALWKLFENPEANGPGIISFITASSYLVGPGFVGMRQKMREAFDDLWILDLGGDQHGSRKTENVFAIQTAVAIAIGVRYGLPRPQVPAKVRYSKISGTREEKLATLKSIQSFADLNWQECFDGWIEPFLPRQHGDYFTWPLLTDLFPCQVCGAKYERNWPIGETRAQIEARWLALVAAPADEKRRLFREDDDRQVHRRYLSLRNPKERLPAINELTPGAEIPEIVRYGWRSFDRQFALADNRVGGRLNPSLWRAHSERQVYLTSLLTGVMGPGSGATVTSYIPDLHYFCGRGGKDVMPLYMNRDATKLNVTNNLLERLSADLGLSVSGEDFFSYAYALLSTPDYVETFSEELTLPGPRLPITKDRDLFMQARDLGRELVWLHTYGERFAPREKEHGRIPQGKARCRQGIPTSREGYPVSFSFESVSGTLRVGEGVFSPVSDDVWEFTVSGLPVVESWLSYRMKSGAGRSSSPLDAIRPEQWTATMTQELLELLWVLEGTSGMFAKLGRVLNAVIAGETFNADELPEPCEGERQALKDEDTEPQQREMDL